MASIYFVFDCSILFKADKMIPKSLVDKVSAAMAEGDVLKALKACESEPGPLANILSSAFSHVEEGFDVIQEAISAAADIETERVMQRINWQNPADGLMYSTNKNVARSLSSGVEITVKNKIGRRLDLTTNANAYYYKLNGFSYDIDGQTVTGEANHNFTWNARMTASVILPYDISLQASGRYNARQVITQGYRKANYSVDLGVRKNFFNKLFTLSLNCRDLLNSRKWENFTSSDTFSRHQLNKRGGRNLIVTLTWNFGNMNSKKRPQRDDQNTDDFDSQQQYSGGEM